jgi:hypothetical protein
VAHVNITLVSISHTKRDAGADILRPGTSRHYR